MCIYVDVCERCGMSYEYEFQVIIQQLEGYEYVI